MAEEAEGKEKVVLGGLVDRRCLEALSVPGLKLGTKRERHNRFLTVTHE